MKQHISKSNWNELNEKEKWFLLGEMRNITKKDEIEIYKRAPVKFYKNVLEQAEERIFGTFDFFNPITIGELIEYLGDHWLRELSKNIKSVNEHEHMLNNNFCNALWIACVYKLKNK